MGVELSGSVQFKKSEVTPACYQLLNKIKKKPLFSEICQGKRHEALRRRNSVCAVASEGSSGSQFAPISFVKKRRPNYTRPQNSPERSQSEKSTALATKRSFD